MLIIRAACVFKWWLPFLFSTKLNELNEENDESEGDSEKVGCLRKDKDQEVGVITPSNTSVYPNAVMVVTIYTHVASLTVPTPR